MLSYAVTEKATEIVRDLLEKVRTFHDFTHAELRLAEEYLQISNGGRGYVKPVHYCLEEFVPPELHTRFGDCAWWFVNPHIVWTADAVWEYFKPDGNAHAVYVNNWKWGGDKKWRGWRPPECPLGAEYSQHKQGCAVDFVVRNMSSEEVRQEILSHQQHPAFQYITTVETGTPHVHVDCRNTGLSNIFVVTP